MRFGKFAAITYGTVDDKNCRNSDKPTDTNTRSLRVRVVFQNKSSVNLWPELQFATCQSKINMISSKLNSK